MDERVNRSHRRGVGYGGIAGEPGLRTPGGAIVERAFVVDVARAIASIEPDHVHRRFRDRYRRVFGTGRIMGQEYLRLPRDTPVERAAVADLRIRAVEHGPQNVDGRVPDGIGHAAPDGGGEPGECGVSRPGCTTVG